MGLAAAATAFTALAAGAAYAFGKFEESENVMQQTGAVLKSTGSVAHVTAGQIDALANSISAVSGVDDETIQSGENMLLTFKNIRNEAGAGNDIFNQTVQAMTDVAAGMAAASNSAINVKSASIQLGKALNDPIAGMSALTRVGIQFSEEQQNQIAQLVKHNNLLGAQKIILAEVTSQFAGSAEANATASGKTSVALENLAETVGKVLSPAFEWLLGQLQTLIAWLQDKVPPAWDAFKEGVTKAWDAVRPFAEAIGSVLIPLFETMWHTIQDRILPVLNRIKPLLIIIGAAVVLFATMILVQFALVVTAVGFIIDKLLDLVGFIRDKVVEPVVNFLGRIVSFLQEKLRPAWDLIRDAAVVAFHAILGPIQAVIDKVETLVGWIQDAIGWLAKLGSGSTPTGGLPIGRGGGFTPPVPPQAIGAEGGFVARTGFALIHKGETLSPAGSGMTVNIYGDVTGEEIVRKVRDGLLKLGNRNAGTGL